MMLMLRCAAIAGVCLLTACAQQVHRTVTVTPVSCDQRATQIIAANVASITSHRYADASRAAEHAGRVSLSCAAESASQAQRFADRWRGANALVVAAELAHEANDYSRARGLLHEGYAIMHTLRPPHEMSELTSTLIVQKLDSARHDMAGQWAYW